MSRQVDKKVLEIADYLAKVLEAIDIKQVDFALECKINPGTLSKALERLSFSDDIVDKIFDRYGIRKEYWDDGKEPIFTDNGTYVKTRSILKKQDPEEEIRILRLVIEKMGNTNDYLLKRITELGG